MDDNLSAIKTSEHGTPSHARKTKRRGSLFAKLFVVIFSFAIIMAALYMIDYIPRQKRSLLNAIESEARSVSASISQVCANALVGEDYGFIVEHSMGVLKDTAGILYIVVVRKNGFTLVFSGDGWEQKDSPGDEWTLDENTGSGGAVTKSGLTNDQVYRYAFPLVYSGLRWGHLQIGLSLENLNREIHYLYASTMVITLVFLLFGIAGAFFIARKLTRPIYTLLQATHKISEGDLSTRARINTKDEIRELADAFNNMTEKLANTTISRDYMTNVLSNMNDTLIVVSPSSRIRLVNQAGVELLGYSSEKMMSMGIDQFHLGESPEGPGIDIPQIIEKKNVRNQERFCCLENGDIIPVLFSASVMVTKADEIDGVVCAFIDITQRKKAETELNQALQESHQANIAKSQFLANMSHELRTPLNHIIGFTELVVEQHVGPLNEQQKELLNDSLGSSRHLLDLINDILDISKVETGKQKLSYSRIELPALIAGCIKMVQKQTMEKEIRVDVIIDDCPESLWADERKLKQIMYNLLSNAVKFTPENGRIVILAEPVMQSNGNLVRTDGSSYGTLVFGDEKITRHQNYAGISVSDDGIGIDPADLDTVFKPFEQIDSTVSRKYQGSGLGLAMVKILVELHDGRVWAQSHGLEKGSKFIFVLPITKHGLDMPDIE